MLRCLLLTTATFKGLVHHLRPFTVTTSVFTSALPLMGYFDCARIHDGKQGFETFGVTKTRGEGSEGHKVLYHMATWGYIPAGKEAGTWNWAVIPPRAEIKESLELHYHHHIWFHDVRLSGKLTLTVTVRIRIVCQATANILSLRIMNLIFVDPCIFI
jgi:hypothetical protein